jgi:folate-binding protein YgfZ
MAATTLTDRAIVRLYGEGVHEFLQGLVTVDMKEVTARTPKWAGLLSAQGKCLFDFILWGDGETPDGEVWIDCEKLASDDLVKRLSMYRLRRPITIDKIDDSLVHWSLSEPHELGGGNVFGAVPDPRLPELGYRWTDSPTDAASGWTEHRLNLGVCEGRAELGDILWLECNAVELNGVSFTKGCFVGQENTARMNWRQKVNRRLAVVPTTEAGPRTRVVYEDLGLAVEHRRVDDLAGALTPPWLATALSATVE